MLDRSPFYFGMLKKYTALFGTLFNDLKIERKLEDVATQLIKVPLMYGPKDRMIARVLQDPNLDRGSAIITLPALSYEMGNPTYDPKRAVQATIRHSAIDPTDDAKKIYQYSPVPYNIPYKLWILSKTIEDGHKILEMILPTFRPDWSVSAHLVESMNEKRDISIVLDSVSKTDSYEDGMKKVRYIIWELDFTLKGYFYGPITSSKVIKFVEVNLFVPNVPDGQIETVVGTLDPIETIKITPGLTANGEPTSNAEMSIPVADINADDNYGYVVVIESANNG